MNARIKVLQVVERTTRGGIYRVVSNLLYAFQGDEEIDMHVALLDVKQYRAEFSFAGVNPPTTVVEGTVLSKILRLRKLAHDHHIVHLHGFSPWTGLAVILSGSSIVYTNHGLFGEGRSLKPYEYIKRWLSKFFLRYFVDRIANISDYAQVRIHGMYSVPLAKCTVVSNCTRWKPRAPKAVDAEPLRIGYHGRFAQVKRVDRVIDIAADIAGRFPVKVVLVGDGPLKESLIEKAKTLGVELDIVDHQEDVRPFVECFDVEIQASHVEYFGLSVIEAIQAGVPVFVLAQAGGCAEIFDKDSTWFVCANEVEVAEKIASMRNRDVRERAVREIVHLQERVGEVYSLKKFAEGYRRVYRSILEKGKPQVRE